MTTSSTTRPVKSRLTAPIRRPLALQNNLQMLSCKVTNANNIMSRSPVFGKDIRLEVIDLHQEQDMHDLILQRKICGWNFSREIIGKWRDLSDQGLKTIFWILIPGKDNVKAGHISLASKAEPHDPDLAQKDRSVMTISTFFVLPEHRSGGIGRQVMDLMEEMATKEPYGSPRCKALAIDTISTKYYDPSNPMWPFLKDAMEKQPSNQLWYERRGYVPFKVIPRYHDSTLTGDVVLDACFLRKEL